MDQQLLTQYSHRVGQELSGKVICDGCERPLTDGEICFRCMECSGFVLPNSDERKVREFEVTTTTTSKYGNTKLVSTNTVPFTGYDLCLECAKKRSIHNHHHFTLAICRR